MSTAARRACERIRNLFKRLSLISSAAAVEEWPVLVGGKVYTMLIVELTELAFLVVDVDTAISLICIRLTSCCARFLSSTLRYLDFTVISGGRVSARSK